MKEIVRYPAVRSRHLEAFYLTADIVERIIDLDKTVVHLPTHATLQNVAILSCVKLLSY